MNTLMRRRMMGQAQNAEYITDFPEFNDYGVYLCTVLTCTKTGGSNQFIKSGTTSYTYAGGLTNVQTIPAHKVTISESTIEVLHYVNGVWKNKHSKAFAGFPVKYKICGGEAGSAPVVTFRVTKEA